MSIYVSLTETVEMYLDYLQKRVDLLNYIITNKTKKEEPTYVEDIELMSYKNMLCLLKGYLEVSDFHKPTQV